jgi:aspartate 1-decarboxylase
VVPVLTDVTSPSSNLLGDQTTTPRGWYTPVFRNMLKSKIHRATVTEADLDYVGSITNDADLMEAANLLPHEAVHVLDVTNGARLETYVIPGDRGSGVIGINGAAAHLVHPGDLVIIVSYASVTESDAAHWLPTVVHVDPHNQRVAIGHDGAEPVPVGALPPA